MRTQRFARGANRATARICFVSAVCEENSTRAKVTPETTGIGNVTLGARTNVWFGAVIRGDNEPIRIGGDTKIREGAVLHFDPGYRMDIGANVTVRHQAMPHRCTIGYGTLIGIQAVVMNGAVIGRGGLVGAGAIIMERMGFPDRSRILGAPAKVARELWDKEVAWLADSAVDYVMRGVPYRSKLERIGRSRGAESLVRVQGTHVRGCNGFIGDRLARSVRGVACAPPKGSVARRRGH
jgi:carbonic anhydrase/acetyltransferase-like protein (isoleucine patch superfamily)